MDLDGKIITVVWIRSGESRTLPREVLQKSISEVKSAVEFAFSVLPNKVQSLLWGDGSMVQTPFDSQQSVLPEQYLVMYVVDYPLANPISDYNPSSNTTQGKSKPNESAPSVDIYSVSLGIRNHLDQFFLDERASSSYQRTAEILYQEIQLCADEYQNLKTSLRAFHSNLVLLMTTYEKFVSSRDAGVADLQSSKQHTTPIGKNPQSPLQEISMTPQKANQQTPQKLRSPIQSVGAANELHPSFIRQMVERVGSRRSSIVSDIANTALTYSPIRKEDDPFMQLKSTIYQVKHCLLSLQAFISCLADDQIVPSARDLSQFVEQAKSGYEDISTRCELLSNDHQKCMQIEKITSRVLKNLGSHADTSSEGHIDLQDNLDLLQKMRQLHQFNYLPIIEKRIVQLRSICATCVDIKATTIFLVEREMSDIKELFGDLQQRYDQACSQTTGISQERVPTLAEKTAEDVSRALLCDDFSVARFQKKIALVIGNSHYNRTSLHVVQSQNDARDLRKILDELEFTVMMCIDTNTETMNNAIKFYVEQLQSDPQALGLFYYSGQSVQVSRRQSFLSIQIIFCKCQIRSYCLNSVLFTGAYLFEMQS
eukprot:TRINITY_DN5689_c0_g3_i3.p1 TRINITY_DN5689_c0_g3~~TRINITY_DN5689_c0_g3_i3.p1  ORF type:complete len:597 (-),score=112.42 TRINITY_DN5689_c0_g3_i3:344-2134(-)